MNNTFSAKTATEMDSVPGQFLTIPTNSEKQFRKSCIFQTISSSAVVHNLLILFFINFIILSLQTERIFADSSLSIEKRQLIAIGDAHFPPFTYLENGEPKGFNIDLLKELALRKKISIAFKLSDWPTAMRDVRNGEADILLGACVLKERLAYLDFSERMLNLKSYLFVTKENIAVTRLEDIKPNIPVGVENSDVNSQYLYAKYPEIKQKEYPNQQAVIEALERHEVEIAVLDYYGGMYVLQKLNLTDKIKFIGEPVYETAYCLGVNKENESLLKALNEGLEEIKNDGTIRGLQNRWFGAGYFSNENWRYVGYGIILFSIIAVFLFIWNISLHRAVRNRTLQLAESDELFRFYMEYSPVYMFVKDENLRTLKLSLNYEKMLGRPIKELLGKSTAELFPPGLAENIDEVDRKIVHEGRPVEIIEELGGRIFNTIKFPITRKGKPPYLAGFTIDITDQKHFEQLLTQEKERLAITLRSIGDGVITTDINGNILTINKVAEKLTGWYSGEAIGHPLPEVFNIINEITKLQRENPVERVLKTGGTVELANHTCLLSKDGREIIIADSGAPIRDNESRIIGVVLVFRDMTEKQKLNDSMQRAQKLESLGVLAGGIAHDFNNLLGGVFGYLDLANESATGGNLGQVKHYLTKTLDVFERAKALTQQLLTFSKGGAPIRKTIQLAPLVTKSVQFALSGSNVACQFDIANDIWLCDCDENQMGQVIDNIVINAKQAMPIGGNIYLKMQNVSIKRDQTSVFSYPANFVKISIKDHGIGMSREILSRIFDPFFSTKETGHGLGLATVFSIVQRHDGWVDVESEPGKGSVFHIFIPASKKKLSIATSPQQIEHRGSGTILVMDDEVFMLDIIDEVLKIMGYTVIRARNGDEVIRLFTEAEKTSKPFLACILDLTIPGGMGGKETAIEIRKIKKDAILIAASGYSEHPIMSKPTDHGFSDRIIKPFRQNELSELMKNISTKHNLSLPV